MDAGIQLKLDNPSGRANLLSKLCFTWMINLFYKAARHGLEVLDIYKTLDPDKSEMLGDKLENYWNQETQKLENLKKKQKPSLFTAMRRLFFWNYMYYGIFLFVQFVFLRSCQPLVLAYLIALFSPEAQLEDQTQRMYISAAVLIAFSVGIIFLQHHTNFGMAMVGMRMRVAVCSLMYRKLLKLNKRSLGQTASGQVVNLLSNDVSRFDYLSLAMHYIWIAPFQVAIVTYFIWNEVQIATLAGVLSMILFTLPVQGVLGKYVTILRGKIAVCTDSRVRLMNEIVSGIQVIKMYAWEVPFQKLVRELRAREVDVLTKAAYIRGIFLSCMVFIERMTAYLTIITYVLLGNEITADKVFSLAQFFNSLQLALAILIPLAIQMIAESVVSVQRIQEFLLMQERGETQVHAAEDNKVRLHQVNASWVGDQKVLKSVNFEVPAGKLCAIVGPVGAGKSSILNLLLGELSVESGKVSVCGTISYASQEPWLFQATVRNNILFGKEYNKVLYRKVTKVCALLPDFDQMPNRDKTIVGERGVSLSGGQRARINLARAVYRDADIYLMDDPLSAVDTHVGKHLFEECIRTYLSGKTRILVTHQLQYLKNADWIIVINDGKIEAQGTFEDLQNSDLDFVKMVVAADETVNEEIVEEKKSKLERSDSTKTIQSVEEEVVKNDEDIGWSGRSALRQYIAAAGNCCVIFVVSLIIIMGQVFSSACDYWSGYWTEQEALRHAYDYNRTVTPTLLENLFGPIVTREEVIFNSLTGDENGDHNIYDTHHLLSKPTVSTNMAIYIYTGLIIALIIFTMMRSFAFFKVTMVAAKRLHAVMFAALLEAPMRFFDTNPSGRILNRFSKDMGAIDELLPRMAMEAMQIMLVMTGILVMICVSNYYLVIAIAIFAVFFILLRKWYLDTVKTLKHIEGTTKSPVFSHMNSSLNGITTIRASHAEMLLVKEFDHHQNVHTSAWYLTIACTESFGLWIDMLCVLFTAVITFSFIVLNEYGAVSGSAIGLAISQSLILTGMLQHGMRQTAEVVNQMTSVERILQYTMLDKEGPFEQPKEKPIKANWPSTGNITFHHMYLRYNPYDAPVLNNLNIQILSGQKIGIVGRTGAGKSSLMTALFRLSPIEGIIEVDNINTQQIGLSQLRRKISIIPQEPILFSATLRYNLDPFGEYKDDLIWSALGEVELKESVASLDFMVDEGGSNFSVGQRQLICLARAILRNNTILVLDEATANIDPKTDALIQRTIRRKFNKCTVLTIAHRLNTIMDSDKVLVLDAGKMIEFDHPYNLLQKEDGHFLKMVEKTGSGMTKILFDIAKNAHDEMHFKLSEDLTDSE